MRIPVNSNHHRDRGQSNILGQPIEVTPTFVIAEWGADTFEEILVKLSPDSTFTICGDDGIRTYRLVWDVELDEHPVIYLGCQQGEKS